MKNYNASFATAPIWQQVADFGSQSAAFIAARVSGFGKGVSRVITQMQIARMQSVFHAMSDVELQHIGLERRDIRRHSETLIKYEYDGL
jgi:hypothetical protein